MNAGFPKPGAPNELLIRLLLGHKRQFVPGLGRSKLLLAGRVLVPQLHEIHPAGHRRGDVAPQRREITGPPLLASLFVEVTSGVDTEVETSVVEAGSVAGGARGHGSQGRRYRRPMTLPAERHGQSERDDADDGPHQQSGGQ